MRVVRGNAVRVSHAWTALDGVSAPTQGGVSDVSLQVLSWGGRVDVTPDGLAIDTPDDSAVSSVVLPASLTQEYDTYELRWAATVDGYPASARQTLRVVAGRYFALEELQEREGVRGFPPAALEAARHSAESLFADYTRQFWCAEYVLEELCTSPPVPNLDEARNAYTNSRYAYYQWGWGNSTISRVQVDRFPVQAIVRAGYDEPTLDVSEWNVLPDNTIDTDGYFPEDYQDTFRIGYAAGYLEPPSDLREACVVYARHLLLNLVSELPDRARRMQHGDITFTLDVAAKDRPTGLPPVDSALNRHRELYFAVG